VRSVRSLVVAVVVAGALVSGCGGSSRNGGARSGSQGPGIASTSSNAISCSTIEAHTPPLVVGLTQRAAVTRLRRAGFRADVFLQGKPNPVVGAGIVVKQAPTDLRVCKGIPITLIVSSDGSRGNRSEGTETSLRVGVRR
jgi:hypothetical protein